MLCFPEPCGVSGSQGVGREGTHAGRHEDRRTVSCEGGRAGRGRPRAGVRARVVGRRGDPGPCASCPLLRAARAVPARWGLWLGSPRACVCPARGPVTPQRSALHWPAGPGPEPGEGLRGGAGLGCGPRRSSLSAVAQVPPGRRAPRPGRDLPSRREDALSGQQHPAQPRGPPGGGTSGGRQGAGGQQGRPRPKKGRTRLGKAAFPPAVSPAGPRSPLSGCLTRSRRSVPTEQLGPHLRDRLAPGSSGPAAGWGPGPGGATVGPRSCSSPHDQASVQGSRAAHSGMCWPRTAVGGPGSGARCPLRCPLCCPWRCTLRRPLGVTLAATLAVHCAVPLAVPSVSPSPSPALSPVPSVSPSPSPALSPVPSVSPSPSPALSPVPSVSPSPSPALSPVPSVSPSPSPALSPVPSVSPSPSPALSPVPSVSPSPSPALSPVPSVSPSPSPALSPVPSVSPSPSPALSPVPSVSPSPSPALSPVPSVSPSPSPALSPVPSVSPSPSPALSPVPSVSPSPSPALPHSVPHAGGLLLQRSPRSAARQEPPAASPSGKSGLRPPQPV
nr:vegetative cell wall protein gp1-like [Vulpes vulpes]